MFLPQDRASRSGMRCRSLTFQFLVVNGDTLVFMVLPGQSSTAAGAEQLADILSSGGPRCVLPRQGSTAAGAEQIADIPSSGGPHGFIR